MPENGGPRVLTVSELNASIRGLLETQFPFVSVAGEISNLKRPYSGHLYFTLKDEDAQIRGVLFKMQQRYLSHLPADGQQVICRGRITVYEPRGDYQLLVDHIEPRGAGALQLAFELLKKKLESEGLFDPTRKKRLPLLPERIALVTSPDGAAVHDFLKTAAQRFSSIPIDVYPVRVQGEGAAGDIVAALALANQQADCSLIVLCRGGGSLEDLWPFNEERVARAIAASALPVVTAIGHEVDYTIADFVGDLRAATPTAAAETVLPDRRLLQEKTNQLVTRITRSMTVRLAASQKQVETCRRMLGDPRAVLAHLFLRLDHLRARMDHALGRALAARQARLDRQLGALQRHHPALRLRLQEQYLKDTIHRFQRAMLGLVATQRTALRGTMALLDAVSPLATLARGYSVLRTLPDHHVIRSSKEVAAGEQVEMLLAEGSLVGKILEKRNG